MMIPVRWFLFVPAVANWLLVALFGFLTNDAMTAAVFDWQRAALNFALGALCICNATACVYIGLGCPTK